MIYFILFYFIAGPDSSALKTRAEKEMCRNLVADAKAKSERGASGNISTRYEASREK